MKVFVSWSGDVSKKIAVALKEWVPYVIQGTELFVSSQDIAKGERNAQSMWDALDGYEFGLSIITKQNKHAPWIMFEAGAMMKFTTGRVVPILCNVDRLDIVNTPLNSFQCSTLDLSEMMAIANSMNEVAGFPLTKDALEKTFTLWWPEFEKKIQSIDMNTSIIPDEKKIDSSEHFKRLENGITSLMGMVNKLHQDASEERAIRNAALNSGRLGEVVLNLGKRGSLGKMYVSSDTRSNFEKDIIRNTLQDLVSSSEEVNKNESALQKALHGSEEKDSSILREHSKDDSSLL